MNLFLGTSHMNTLRDLMNIADKHNCYIIMGTYNYSSNEFDSDDFKYNNVDNKILNYLDSNSDEHIQNYLRKMSDVWFELHDKRDDSVHRLIYREIDISLTVNDITILYNNLKEYEDELESFMEDMNSYDDNNYFGSFTSAPTIIKGFGKDNSENSGRVYRSGMVVHVLSELVCEYLNEPIVKRVY